jgi:predicted Zn-dependent peptidase
MKDTRPQEEFETQDLGGGVRLHMLPTPSFKTVLLEVYVAENLGEHAGRTALLPMVLRRGTERFGDMQDLARHLDDLYGASFHADIVKIGERLLPIFRIDVLSSRCTAPGAAVLEQAFEVLAEVMHRPRLSEGVFLRPFVEGEKTNLIQYIRSLQTDHDHYAAQQCLQKMCRGEPYAYYEYGREEDVAQATPEDLFAYYERLRGRHPLEIFAVGDFDPGKVRALAASAFGRPGTEPQGLPEAPFIADAGPLRTFTEDAEIEQAKVAVGYRTGVRYTDPELGALMVYNGIFGGDGFSKLFRTVREEEGLAYYVGSQIERSKGIMLVSTGIAPDRFDRFCELLGRIEEQMRTGDISEEELESVRVRLVSRFRGAVDTLRARASLRLEGLVNHSPRSLGDFIREIEAVTLEGVVEVARRVRRDTIFLLRPGGSGDRKEAAAAAAG